MTLQQFQESILGPPIDLVALRTEMKCVVLSGITVELEPQLQDGHYPQWVGVVWKQCSAG